METIKFAISTLASASRATRAKEHRAFSHAQMLAIHARLATSGIPARKMERIMKRVKSRTRKIIRSSGALVDKTFTVPMQVPEPDWINDAFSMANTLHRYRTHTLRKEIRAFNLAYAFLRGLDLESVEEKGYEPIPLDRIETIVAHFTQEEPRVWQQKFAAWKDAAVSRGKHPLMSKNEERAEERVRASKEPVGLPF